MNRFALLGVVTLLVTGLGVATTGAPTTLADRSIDVTVSDDDGLVGVTACQKSRTTQGSSPVRVAVSNRFTDPLAVVSITSTDAARTDNRPSKVVEPGEQRTFEVVFDGAVDTVAVDFSGAEFTSSVVRSVQPKRQCPFGQPDESGESEPGESENGEAESGNSESEPGESENGEAESENGESSETESEG